MFDQLKKLKQLKDMQDALKKERVEIEKNGVKIAVNGSMDIEEVKLNSELDIMEQERLVKDCFKEAKDQVQKAAAKRLMDSGFGF